MVAVFDDVALSAGALEDPALFVYTDCALCRERREWVDRGVGYPNLGFGRWPAPGDVEPPAQCCTIVCDGDRSGQEARG